MPEAECSATNAVNLLKSSQPKVGSSFIGGLTMGGGEIKISARAVLDLLAGRISQEDFFKAYKFIPDGESAPLYNNPFEAELNKGRLLVEIEVEESERDDNWLVIKFGDPDPAISPFRAPAKDISTSKKRYLSKPRQN